MDDAVYPDEFDANACPDCGEELDVSADNVAFCPRCCWLEPDDEAEEEE